MKIGFDLTEPNKVFGLSEFNEMRGIVSRKMRKRMRTQKQSRPWWEGERIGCFDEENLDS